MGVGSEGQLIFGLFSVAPLSLWKRLKSTIFRDFLLFFSLFFRCPLPEIFSTNALGCTYKD